jgi:hypothetical protein
MTLVWLADLSSQMGSLGKRERKKLFECMSYAGFADISTERDSARAPP